MALSDIKTALFNRLESLVGLPDIFYPNISADIPTTDYIRPDVLPATTDSIGVNNIDQERGVFQVSIFVEKGKGELEAARIGQIILDGFPRNTNLLDVRIDRTGTIERSFFDGKWAITPVSISYQNII